MLTELPDSSDFEELKGLLQQSAQSFVSWHEPMAVLDELDRMNVAIATQFPQHRFAFLTHRDAKPLREIWVLAKFASAMSFPAVKLSKDLKVDGFVKKIDKVIPAEVIEILEPGRRRGLEFGPDTPPMWDDPGEEWVRRADAIPEALLSGLTKKKEKPYPESTELFVYLNISEYGIRQKEIESYIHRQLAASTTPFSAIHVKWKEKIFSSLGLVFGNEASGFEDFDEGNDE